MPVAWTNGSPESIAANIRRLADQVPKVVHDVAIDQSSRAQSHMKRNRPWEDQTGAARRELYGTAEKFSWGSRITLGGGTAESRVYFRFLELGTSKMAARPILLPTMRIYRVNALRAAALAVKGLLA